MYRLYVLLAALLQLGRNDSGSYITLLETDRLWGTWKTRCAIKKIASRSFAYLLPRLVLYDAMPWHHPSRIPDPAPMKEWVALFDEGGDGLDKVDTTQIERSAPVPALAVSTA